MSIFHDDNKRYEVNCLALNRWKLNLVMFLITFQQISKVSFDIYLFLFFSRVLCWGGLKYYSLCERHTFHDELSNLIASVSIDMGTDTPWSQYVQYLFPPVQK